MTEATPLASEQITQEDICAAVDLKYALDGAGSTSWSVRSADPREHPVTIAFARHRIAALSASPAPSGQGVSVEVATLLNELATYLQSIRVFLTSRERTHEAGLQWHDELVAKVNAAREARYV